jgi:hypothetical protein
MIHTYGLRFKIEVSFKVALRSIGVYSYRFWSKTMHAIKRRSKGQWLHRETAGYRDAMLKKVTAYHAFVQVGCIAQGTLQFLCVYHAVEVWGSFNSFMRTIRRDLAPSERVASLALQNCLPEFLAVGSTKSELSEILCPKLALERLPGARLAA